MNKTTLYFLGAVAVGYALTTNLAQIPGLTQAINAGYNLGFSGSLSINAS